MNDDKAWLASQPKHFNASFRKSLDLRTCLSPTSHLQICLMKLLYFFIIIIFQFSWSAAADSFSGIIEKRPGSIHLLTPTTSYRMVALNSVVAKDLNKLQSGDYLQGYGIFNKEQEFIKVQSVDFVGLRHLLGIWESETQVVLNVANFSEMSVYLPAEQDPDQNRPVLLNYTVAPEAGNGWTIILHTDSEIQAGRIELEQDQLVLEIGADNNQKQSLKFTRAQ